MATTTQPTASPEACRIGDSRRVATCRPGPGSISRYQKRRVLDPGPGDAVPFKQHSRSSHEDPWLAGRLSRGRDAYFGQVVVKDGDACQSYGYSPPLHGAVQNPVACRTPCGRSSQLGCHRCERFQCHRAQSGVTGRVLNEYLEAVLARWQLRRPGDVADYVPERCIDQPDHGGFVGRVHFRGPLTRLDAGPDGERQGQRPHGPGRKCTATVGRLALLHASFMIGLPDCLRQDRSASSSAKLQTGEEAGDRLRLD